MGHTCPRYLDSTEYPAQPPPPSPHVSPRGRFVPWVRHGRARQVFGGSIGIKPGCGRSCFPGDRGVFVWSPVSGAFHIKPFPKSAGGVASGLRILFVCMNLSDRKCLCFVSCNIHADEIIGVGQDDTKQHQTTQDDTRRRKVQRRLIC